MTCKPRILSRLLVSAAAACLVAGPALAGIPFPTSGPSLPHSEDIAAQVALPSVAPNRNPHAPPPVRVAASDLEAFGIVIPEVTPPGDTDYLPRILADYRSGDVEEADILKSKLKAPAALAVAEWAAIRSRTSLGFERIVAFQRDYKDWPISTLLQRRAEEALLRARKPSAAVRQYFKDRPPITGQGRIALAFALKTDGQEAQAIDLVRRIWREDSFGPDTEERIREEFPTALSLADHRFRMERYLFRESWGAALRAAGYAGKDYAALVKARMGAFEGKKKAEKAFAAVPETLRSDSSYIFSRALYLRRQGKLVDAAQLMAKAPRDPNVLVDGDDWWDERRLIARKLLDDGKYEDAYQVASLHGAEGAAERIEAEFHAGWIALRFLHKPEQAAKHFAEAANIAGTPISVARAAYWQGRALEAAGAAGDARRYYQRAADKPTTYYGQLAREKLGLPLELRRPDQLDAQGREAFEALLPVQALRLLDQIGETELAIALYADLARSFSESAQLDALGSLAAEQNNPRAMLTVGKIAVQRDFPLDPYAYPVSGIPSFEPVANPVDRAMVYAIARQESAFNPQAQSSAGARGLMQLMPATAKRTAERFGLGFDVKRLTQDPAYNAKIGSAHLSELMGDWKGSYILAFASYNAGGGNVMKWIKAYGDPRKPGVDEVDWIERIPFHETRNYVQRVLENLAVYRRRLTRTSQEAAARPAEEISPAQAHPPAPKDKVEADGGS